MTTETSPAPTHSALVWTGRVISTLVALLLLASGLFKLYVALIDPSAMPKSDPDTGWPPGTTLPLGIVEITCTLLYLFPRTSVLGAILLTGYMGGAIATHARVGDVFVVQAIVGVLVWLGLFLRDARLRALIPWKQ
jgi:uncharacterized membrane protein YphA (DoxX/SURF4 family)